MKRIIFSILIGLLFVQLAIGQTSGTGPFTLAAPENASNFQWYQNNSALAGPEGTDSLYSTSSAGVYWVEYDIDACVDEGDSFHVILDQNDVNNSNLNAVTGKTSYQWFKDGVAISGAINATLALTNTTADIGVYYVEYDGATCTVRSRDLTVHLLLADTDGDGVADDIDLDDDNDGILDSDETPSDPLADGDNDGVPAYLDDDDNDNAIGNTNSVVESAFDTDGDNIPNHLDLDSDNDGIYDADEAGHGAAHTAGVVDGPVGTNGLVNALETVADNGTINYTLDDSETVPDGIYDFLETDADGDGCFDAQEEVIDDTDGDGIAGTGIPTVDANGLVTGITYAVPTIEEWQNPAVSSGCGIVVSPRVYLQGAYVFEESKMQDSLRALGYLSLTEPYTNMANFTHVLGGGEVITAGDLTDNGDNSIVDWVFVELRSKSDSTVVLGSQSALLQRDGDIVNAAGSTDLLFTLPADDYYVTVQHRNHLGVMTANTATLSGTTTVVDFTTTATPTWGTHAQKDLGGGTMGLWGGDVSDDGIIRYVGAGTDYTDISSKILLDGANQAIYSTSLPVLEYHNGDVDMNGTIRYVGSGTDQTLISQNVLLHPNNAGVYSVSMPIIEQLPE